MADQEKKPIIQEIKVKGGQLVDKVREIAEEGGARSVSIRKEGRTLLTFPLSVGVGGTAAAILLAPQLAAIGAIAALVTDVDVVVERAHRTEALDASTEPPPPPEPPV